MTTCSSSDYITFCSYICMLFHLLYLAYIIGSDHTTHGDSPKGVLLPPQSCPENNKENGMSFGAQLVIITLGQGVTDSNSIQNKTGQA